MRDTFYSLFKFLEATLQKDELLLASYQGEESDFVRFNRSRIRQAGHVIQGVVELELVRGQRHAAMSVSVSGNRDVDQNLLLASLSRLRNTLPHLPDDPYLMVARDVNSSEYVGNNQEAPTPDAVLDALRTSGADHDMAGLYAGGGIEIGFANSLGQRNWFATQSFHWDWSFYHQADKAVKGSYGGFQWNPQAFQDKIDESMEALDILSRPARTIEPGEVRVFLSPNALKEIIQMLCWGGFGLKAQRTRTSLLTKLVDGREHLADEVTIREHTSAGLAPNFSDAGFLKPECVTLIENGIHRDALVSPRSAKEYGIPTTGGGESPESIDMLPGKLKRSDVLAELGTGVYINSLWYLNYSDRSSGRITGMTRFATFYVEDGVITAPLNVMRFDETIYRLLGSNLQALTSDVEFFPDSNTYFQRSTSSIRLPGALIDGFRFTL